METETKIIEKYGDVIVVFDKPFGEEYEDKFDRKTYGTKNGICEMLNLSKCDDFYGTPYSSFSFMVWLLRDDPELNFWF